MTMRFLGSIAAALAVWSPLAAAQSAAIPRMSNGKPDFTGVWDHPRVADITRNGKGCGALSLGCTQEGNGELSYTEWGLQQWKDVAHRFDYSAHCLPWGYTRAWQVEYPGEIMQNPDRLAILWESNNIFHVVFTDGREHPKDLDPTWMGHSIGKYDGDTLVIDTIGFNGKTWIDTAEHPSSDQLHVVERIHYIDPQHLSYEVTWDDPKTYTKPIRNVRTFSRMKPGQELMEYWCMENNKDLLEGHLSR
ncbi:MAG: hypothetical protein LAP40_06875 [Acidobacteriia bacterium]|nr:hypothetical protein [Terriglobia bacterium]